MNIINNHILIIVLAISPDSYVASNLHNPAKRPHVSHSSQQKNKPLLWLYPPPRLSPSSPFPFLLPILTPLDPPSGLGQPSFEAEFVLWREILDSCKIVVTPGTSTNLKPHSIIPRTTTTPKKECIQNAREQTEWSSVGVSESAFQWQSHPVQPACPVYVGWGFGMRSLVGWGRVGRGRACTQTRRV